MRSRYSLVPEEGEPGAPGTEAAAAGAGTGTAEASGSTAPQPTAAQGALAGAQGAITSVLNRLFGQAGAADSAAPTSPQGQPPSTSPFAAGAAGTSTSAPATGPADDPPDAPLIDFDTPVRGPRTPTPGQPRRQLPEWAQLARGMQPPGTRSDVDAAASQPSGSGFGSSGLVPPNDLFDSDVAQYRATAGAGDIAQIPWNAPNHQHVDVRYAVVGSANPVSGGEGVEAGEDADADLPRLFCHAVGASSIGDFSLLQLRRVAARAEVAPVLEGRMCVHAVARDIGGEAEMGRVMRECRGAGGAASGAGQAGESGGGQEGEAALSYSGERPGSIAPEDID